MIDRFEIVLQEDFEETENNLKHEQALDNLKQEITAQKTKRETGNGAYTKETWDAFVSAYDAAVSAGSDTSTDVLKTLLSRLKETAGKLKPVESNSDLKEFSDGTFMYQVMNATEKTVIVSKLQNAKLKKLQIKDTVKYNNTDYKIVGKKSLKGIHKNAVIRVPAKNLKAYQKLLKKGGPGKTVQIKK